MRKEIENTNKNSRKTLAVYLLTLAFIWLIAMGLLLRNGYQDSFLYLNGHYNIFFDSIMPHLTQLGDSLIISSLIFILMAKRNLSLAVAAFVSVLCSGLMVILLKQLVFIGWDRPLTVLLEHKEIHFIKGYVEYKKSFPSGHSTTVASAIPFFLIFLKSKSWWLAVLFAFVAALLCYTRVYLGSHFLGDVIAGSLLGSLFAVLCLFKIYPPLQRFILLKPEGQRIKISTALLVVGTIGMISAIALKYFL